MIAAHANSAPPTGREGGIDPGQTSLNKVKKIFLDLFTMQLFFYFWKLKLEGWRRFNLQPLYLLV